MPVTIKNRFTGEMIHEFPGADLSGADLRSAKNIPPLAAAQTCITPAGAITGWKKLRDGVIAELLIPADARRSNATGRKCRAEFAHVIGLSVGASARSQHDHDFIYRCGETVRAHEWCEDRWQECAGGIHFFLTREEAEAY